MTEHGQRDQLLQLLDTKAFDPIISKSADEFTSQEQRQKFNDVKRSTQSEKSRFHNDYKTAKDVKNNYLSDLHSQVAKRKNAELKTLGLPKMEDVRDEFLRLCDKLGV